MQVLRKILEKLKKKTPITKCHVILNGVSLFIGNSMTNRKNEFVRLYVDNQSTVYSFILTMVYDVEIAHDLLQETAVFMWERFDSYQPDTNFSNWAVTIARYKVLEYFKQKKRNHPLLTEEQLDYICETTKQRSHKVDKIEILQKCIDRLSDKDRILLSKRYKDGMPIKQIALSLGRSVHGVYKTMARICYALQRCVQISMKSLES